MKAANGLETSRDSGDVHLLESAQRQLDALRAAIDARLAELDAALADPSRASSLTGLILELSRLATAEAQAAATRACLQVRSDSEASRLEAEARNLAAVEAERKLASELRKNFDKAQKALDLLETEKHAVLQAAREQTQLLEAERSARGDLDHTIARLEREVADAQARTNEADESTEQAVIERTHALERVAALEQQLATAQQQLSAERQATETLRQELRNAEARIVALDGQLESAAQRIAEVEQLLTAAQASVRSLEAERVAAGDRIAGLELELEAARDACASAQESALTAAEQRAYAETRLRQQEQQLAGRAQERDRLRTDLDAAQAALSQAAQTDEIQRQAMAATAAELATERQARAEFLAQVDALTRLLDAERGVSADLRHAISAANSAADGEQHAVTTLRQAAADAEQRAADLRLAHAAAQAERDAAQSAHDAAAQALELERQRAADRDRQYTELEQAHGDLQQAHAALSQAHTDLERTSAALHGDLDAQRTASGDADSGLRVELEQARQEAVRARADLDSVQQRLATLEQARATAEESALELGDRVAIVERERDAFSLALDTERMTTADLRETVATADRLLTDASSQIDTLKEQLASLPTAPATPAAQVQDDGDEGEVTELTFDEDQVEQPGDGSITLEEEGWESVRLSTRYTFTSRIDVKVNGVAGVLCDLSVGGCGVRTGATLETGDTVRVQLPQDPNALLCLGQVIWMHKVPASGGTPAATRAGIQFTQADEGALEAFIIMRADV